MKKTFLLIAILVWTIYSKAQLMSEIKFAVSFIYVKDSVGNPVPNGTCFFVGIKSQNDTTQTFPYLVTAKHVLQKKDGSFYKEIFIRMNTIDSSSKLTWVPVDVNSIYKNVFFHSDPSVDIAVMPYVPPKNDYVFKWLDTTFLLDKKDFKNLSLQEGTESFFTGLFTPYTGDKKIFPIVRFGRIALITDEKIEWVGMKREMLLVETSSFGGNSGSPIYFKIISPNGLTKLILGGVLNGTYRDVAEIKVIETSGNFTPFAIYNNGISGITPVYLLKELLYSPEIKRLRN